MYILLFYFNGQGAISRNGAIKGGDWNRPPKHILHSRRLGNITMFIRDWMNETLISTVWTWLQGAIGGLLEGTEMYTVE